VGVKLVALAAAAAVAVPQPLVPAAAYLAGRQQADGGFAEPRGGSDPSLTAWVVLALAAAGRRAPLASAATYLETKPAPAATDLALRVLALRAGGRPVHDQLARLEAQRRPDGRIGPLVNSTLWGILAFRAAGMAAGSGTVRYVLRRQAASGGWSWGPGVAPDSNDTAVAIEALRASGVGGRPIARALAYVRRFESRDGGFALARGRAPDSQSTAWAIQAFVAARRTPPAAAFRFLSRMRRPDGSYRYSARYITTPAWVTAQVLPALARKAYPLTAS
jgi:hypothetical protein